MRSEEEVVSALELYGDTVRRICFIHLKQEADVEDIFQNVFFKYAKNTQEFSSQDHEKAWLIRVAINECNSLMRRWFFKKVDLKDDLSMYGMSDSKQDLSVLQAVLKLPEHYRNVVYLYYYEGYKIKEIAVIMKRKENTIHTWMRRAKEELKAMLGGDYFEETA